MNEDQRPPTYTKLVALAGDLREQDRALRARVAELEARLGQHPRNSSKPPSSEGLAKLVAPKPLRRRTVRKPGGQSGCKGETLRQVAEPDQLVEHRPAACGGCESDLADALDVGSQAWQVFELLDIKPKVTEHQILACRCECGAVSNAAVPLDVAALVQYGLGLAAIVFYLYEGQFLSKERTVQAMSELFGSPMSTSTVEAMASRAMRIIDASGFYEPVRAALRAVACLHVDGPGKNCIGTSALEAPRHHFISAAWLGLADTEARTGVSERKVNAPARRMIDRQAEYWRFTHDDPWAVFANNVAEREIWMIKIKVSGGLRPLERAVCYAALRSYLHQTRHRLPDRPSNRLRRNTMATRTATHQLTSHKLNCPSRRDFK